MRRVVALLVVLIAALATWWALRSERRAPTASELEIPSERDARPPGPILATPGAEPVAPRHPAVPPREGMDRSEGAGEDAEAETFVPLRVLTVDAATGLPIPSTWNLGSEDVGLAKGVPLFVVFPGPPPGAVVEEKAGPGFAAWERDFLPSGAVRPRAIRPATLEGRPRVLLLTVRPPPGYVRPGATLDVTGPLAAGVLEATAVVPVHREAPLRLVILGPDDRPAGGALVRAVEVAGRRVPFATEDLGPGEILVRGIAHLAGEPVAIAVEWDGVRPAVDGPPPPHEGIESPAVRAVVPADLSRPWAVVVRLAGPTETDLSDHNETDNDLPLGEAVDVHVYGPVGSARVVVFGWDGRPVRGAVVSCFFRRRTDAEGVTRLDGLPVGEWRFGAESRGRFPAEATGTVREGAQADVVLREPVGAVLDVLVTDVGGEPRPGALVTVLDARVFDVEEGVQRLDRYTDAQGRRTFARVEPGAARVNVSWGSRLGSATVMLRDGERAGVHVVVK